MHGSAFRMVPPFLLLLALAPMPARAIDYFPVSDDQPNYTFRGDQDNLPVRPMPWREAVAYAHTMPGVQLAYQTCVSRGYFPNTAHDTAYISIDPPATLVVMPFTKPGMTLPPDSWGWPVVMVCTRLNGDGIPSTVITGGIVVLDGRNQTIYSADSLDQYRASDPSFDVETQGGGDPGPAERRLGGRLATPSGSWQWFTDPKSRFNKFIRCLGSHATSCSLAVLDFNPIPGGGILITVTNPEIAVTFVIICTAVTSAFCDADNW